MSFLNENIRLQLNTFYKYSHYDRWKRCLLENLSTAEGDKNLGKWCHFDAIIWQCSSFKFSKGNFLLKIMLDKF